MTLSEAQAWAVVIGAIGAAIAAVIGALNTHKTKKIAVDNTQKLDLVQETASETKHLANGNASELREELRVSNAKNKYLNELVLRMADKLPPGEVDKIQIELEAIGRRRKDDLLRAKEEV